MAARIKKDDTVIVISGKYKGRTGKVIQMLPKKAQCIVEKVNVVKRHQKAKGANQPAGIIEKALPIDLSKVMPFDETKKTGTRVQFVGAGEKKTRKLVKSGKTLAA